MTPLDFRRLWLPNVSLKLGSGTEDELISKTGWLRASLAISDFTVCDLPWTFAVWPTVKCPMLRGRCKGVPSIFKLDLEITWFRSLSELFFLASGPAVTELTWGVTLPEQAFPLTGVSSLLSGTGLNSAPRIIQLSTIAAMISKAPRHPYSVTRCSVRGANMKVPSPEPQTAIPVARERYFSK